MTNTPSPSGNPIRVDWENARRLARGVISKQLHHIDEAGLEDLIQESLIRMLRAMRSEVPREPEALMTTIARRTAIDHLRRRTRWLLIMEPASDASDDHAASRGPRPDQFGDPRERVRFLVVEYFRANSARCYELALEYFQENDWKLVASRLGGTHAAVRRQWSRCIELLREAIRRDPAVAELSDWATEM